MKYQYKVVEDGVTRAYGVKMNTFGSYNTKGKTITFFKLTDCQKYFNLKKGELINGGK